MTPYSKVSISRRDCLRWSGLAVGGAFLGKHVSFGAATTQPEPGGHFTLAQRGDHWWFITPEGEPFFSIALNHIDPAPLRYLENGDLWTRKYGNSMERWLKQSVAPDLRAWGFNSVGWTQEVVTRGPTNHRHSRAFIFEEYQWLGLPYCHLLPFADFHQWENETRYPDFSSTEFADWCDYVGREHCARMAGDPKLIGYFYVDCPTWIHTRPDNRWRGPLFDPAKLKSEAGRRELLDLATRYYRVTHEAVRRYDKNHLILGDRYEANAPIAEEVVRAALPFVDVLSFQHFGPPGKVQADLNRWHDFSGKPVLLADGARQIAGEGDTKRHDPKGYAETLAALRDVKSCVGYHLCGAYLRNNARKRGLRDAAERPDSEAIAGITAANLETARWVRDFRP
ncbi:MAG: hypothetical protein KAX37_06675 [Opitutaceae bacterium]|nr:hypothetical protein [Opitutaceae bacterium]